MPDSPSLFSALDLFAGPGGWDHGIEPLGIRPLGVEWDDAACQTRAAASLLTLKADVSELRTGDFDAELLIASPPCQAFSVAGKGDGNRDVPLIIRAAKALGDGRDERDTCAGLATDSRSLFIVEPLRFALALEPRWIAFEQVPTLLSIWQAFADVLRTRGYWLTTERSAA